MTSTPKGIEPCGDLYDYLLGEDKPEYRLAIKSIEDDGIKATLHPLDDDGQTIDLDITPDEITTSPFTSVTKPGS